MGALLETIRAPHSRWPLLVVVVLLAVCLAGRLDETPVGAVVDDAHYVEMARSVAEGRGTVLHLGPESVPGDTVFPPGLPLLLAPLAGLFPESLTPLKLVPVLALVLLIPLCLAWPGGEDRPHLRVALAAVTVLNPWLIAHACRVVSDVPYTALSLATALLYLRTGARPAAGAGRWVAVGALAGAAVLVRSVGLALLLAMILHLTLQRRLVPAAQLLAGTVLVILLPALLGLSPSVLPLGRTYGSQLADHGDALAVAKTNLLGYVRELPVLVVPVFGKTVSALGGSRIWGGILAGAQVFTTLAVVGAVLAGLNAARRCGDPVRRRAGSFWAIYLAVYGAVLLSFDGYPSGVQLRLLLPVLPILGWFLLEAADAWRGRAALACVLALLLGASLAHDAWRIARPLGRVTDATGHGFVDPGVGADWVLANTDPQDVILVQAPLERHIHLRRPVVGVGVLDADSLAVRVRRFGVALVLVGPRADGRLRQPDEDGNALQTILRGAPSRYPVVHQEEGKATILYGVADAVGRCRWVRPQPPPVR